MLSKTDMALYRRHIDDGMALEDLAPEFGTSPSALKKQFSRIENHLKEKFKSWSA